MSNIKLIIREALDERLKRMIVLPENEEKFKKFIYDWLDHTYILLFDKEDEQWWYEVKAADENEKYVRLMDISQAVQDMYGVSQEEAVKHVGFWSFDKMADRDYKKMKKNSFRY
jgi:hypothetical protein